MFKKKTYTIVIVIFIFTVFAANLSYPQYWNQTADRLNAKKNKIKYIERLSNIPQFPKIPFKLGLDLQGGTHLIYEADLSDIEKEDHSASLESLRDVIEKRVNLFGVQEPVVQVQETAGHHRLIVELAGVKNVSEAIKMIGQTPFLEFKEPKDNYQEILAKKQEIAGKGKEEIEKIENWQMALEDPFKSTGLTGKYLKKATIGFEPNTSAPMILLQFNNDGSKLFEDITARNIGKPLAIYLDYRFLEAPTVRQKISGGSAQVTGNFTIDEVKKRVKELNAGALPVPIKLVSQQTVGPTLGAVSLEKSLKAGIFGFLAVILFMIFFYRLPGILASLSLGIYVVIMLCLFKFIPITLTLAGVGGAILSIGMAIDANVLIFSRFREELEQEQSFSSALEQGFERAWPSIRDGNLTTLIVAIILFSFGTSFVKGFALTLSLGILVSMFSAIFITKSFMKLFEDTRWEKFKWLWR